MWGRLLCSIGLHRWEFREEQKYQARTDGVQVCWGSITYGRCKRRCSTFIDWRAVNIDRIGKW
jgi:hypothetical protein